jgi:hypothetical protein
MKSTVLWLASLILLSACASGGPATDPFCAVSRPILVSRSDVLTTETARQLLAHNETGARICGW